DGVDTGNITPFVVTNLSPGTYTVKLDSYHYKYRTETITVNPNETTYINWSLTYAPDQTLVIQPNAAIGKDSYVYDTSPEDNFGDYTWVTAGTDPTYTVRAYLQFNLDLLPENAVVFGATLGTVYWYSSGSTAAHLGAYNVEEAWGEDSITWENQPESATEPTYYITVPSGVTDGFVYWHITELVQGWWDGSLANYGVVLKATDESVAEAWKRFYSSDWTTEHQRPKLSIGYYDPTS
ncbi:MAG: DNRLRE domain-containing protein, partial [Dehalococcoidia bacterium]